MSTSWRIIHRDPLGADAVTVPAASSFARLDSFRVRGDGDCLEAKLMALASDIGIGPRDILTLEVTIDGSTWTPVYSGVVTQAGALRSADLSDFLVVGLSKRVREVTTDGTTYDEGEIAELVRALAVAHLPDGIVYDAALVPDLGFEVGETQARFNPLGDVLDQLVATCPGFVVPPSETYVYDGVTYTEGQAVPRATWGVDAQRRFYFRRVPGSLALTEGADGTRLDALTPSAEEIVTAVAFVLVGDGGFVGGLKVQDDDLVDAWGEATRVVGLPTSLLVPNDGASGDTLTNDGFVQQSTNGGISWSAVTGSAFDLALVRFSDDDAKTLVRAFRQALDPSEPSPAGVASVGIGVSYAAERSIVTVRVKATAKTRANTGAAWADATLRLYINGGGSIELTSGSFDGSVPLPSGTAADGVYVGTTIAAVGDGFDVQVAELIPYGVNVPDLERLAAGYYRAPAIERIDVTRPGLTLPAPVATVTLAAGGTVTLDVADVDVRITRDRGLESTVHLGQGDDASLIAQAALISGKATRAQLNAIDTLAGSRRRT